MNRSLRIAAMAGWGHTAAAWERLEIAGAEIHPLSLPGHEPESGGQTASCSLGSAAEALAGDWDVVMGWSLGGLAALEALRQGTIRPRGLILMATPPSFLARDTYPAGQPAAVLEDFRAGLRDDPQGTLRRFFALQFRGDRAPRSLWAPAPTRDRFLAADADAEVLGGWLDVLAEADLSPVPPSLELPVLVLHGEEDAVVDPAALDFFRDRGPQVTVQGLSGAGHAPHIGHAEETGKHIAEFVRALA